MNCILADDWEIDFNDISEMQWLASGAQGAVFRGKLNNEVVAVKKVKDPKETDIRHLRKLNHPNIVQFKYNFSLFFLHIIFRRRSHYKTLVKFLQRSLFTTPLLLHNNGVVSVWTIVRPAESWRTGSSC